MWGRVVSRCVEVYRGAGYLAGYDAERFFRDARIYRIDEGRRSPPASDRQVHATRVQFWRIRLKLQMYDLAAI
jgi:hypothetical protein